MLEVWSRSTAAGQACPWAHQSHAELTAASCSMRAADLICESVSPLLQRPVGATPTACPGTCTAGGLLKGLAGTDSWGR